MLVRVAALTRRTILRNESKMRKNEQCFKQVVGAEGEEKKLRTHIHLVGRVSFHSYRPAPEQCAIFLSRPGPSRDYGQFSWGVAGSDMNRYEHS